MELQRKLETAIIVGAHTAACIFIYRLHLEPTWLTWLSLAIVWLGTTANLADPRLMLPTQWFRWAGKDPG